MKKLLFTLAMAGTLALGGCGSEATTSTPLPPDPAPTERPADNTTVVAPADTVPVTQAAQAAYECPMKCEGSASDKPGKCPKCGMDLVKKA